MTQKTCITIALSLIAVLAVSFVVRDWYVLYQCGAVGRCIDDASTLQYVTKFSVTTIITLMALFLGQKNCICKRDRLLVQSGILCAFSADICFKALYNLPGFYGLRLELSLLGIYIFMIFQCIFIYRHTRKRNNDRHFPGVILIPFAVLFLFNALLLLGIFKSTLTSTAATYIAFLVCSLVVACRTTKLKYFPARSAKLIRIGMVLFFFGDLFVGFSLLTGPDHSALEMASAICNNLIWPLYVPALLCLLFSSYRREL